MNRVGLFRSAVRMDERDFEAIFHEQYMKVYAILFRLTADPYEADDLAAETFWRLWERPPAQAENLNGWLYRVATRLGYNNLRASRRRERYEMEAAQEENGWGAFNPASVDPARAAEERMERERAREVLRKMPLRDVQVLVLRHSGFSYKEIAAVVDVAQSSVGTLLSRAEKTFEALYRQGEKDAPKR